MAAAAMKKTRKRVLTRRGVVWLGQTCNLRCHFCYFIDRIACQEHPEHAFMSLDKARAICQTLVDFYHNNAVDIQGGEPTIYPHIYELVRFCRDIGLLPSLISNGIALAKKDVCQKLRESGLRDCLVSVHALGASYDAIVGVKGANKKLLKGIDNLQSLGIPIRFNCVLSKSALPRLVDIATLAAQVGARVVNFIAFNPFEDQSQAGRRSAANVPRYGEVTLPLSEALDFLHSAGIEYNVRYFPFCMVPSRHRAAIYDFQQLPYDLHEWDFASWTWTGALPQRTRELAVARPVALVESTVNELNALDPQVGRVARFLSTHPRALAVAIVPERVIRGQVGRASPAAERTLLSYLYRQNARLRARQHCKYVYDPACQDCDVYDICDGFHGDYAALLGTAEARAIDGGIKVVDPRHFISHQEKIVEEEDHGWAL